MDSLGERIQEEYDMNNNIVELQKALDKFPNRYHFVDGYVDRTKSLLDQEAFDKDAYLTAVENWQMNFTEKFAVFQQSLEKPLPVDFEKSLDKLKIICYAANGDEILMLDSKDVTAFLMNLLHEKILIDRKQVEDMIKEFEHDGTAFLQKYGYCQIKKLLESSEHHFLTVGEAREKLKETSKETEK